MECGFPKIMVIDNAEELGEILVKMGFELASFACRELFNKVKGMKHKCTMKLLEEYINVDPMEKGGRKWNKGDK